MDLTRHPMLTSALGRKMTRNADAKKPKKKLKTGAVTAVAEMMEGTNHKPPKYKS